MADADEYLTTLEVAEQFPFLKSSFLERLRAKGEGPPYVKFGGNNARVLYRRKAVIQWVANQEKETQS